MRRSAARPARNREGSPVPTGFRHNRGVDYVPFNITDEQGLETPARYVQVHMTNNPFVVGRLTLTGADYRGELHAAPVLGTNRPCDDLTPEAMRMFRRDYPASELVDAAIEALHD